MSEQKAPQPETQKDPVIYTIPEQFYGVAAKARLPKETPLPTSSLAIAPSAPSHGVSKTGSRRGSWWWVLIPIGAALLVAGMGLIAWRFLRPDAPVQPAQPVVTLPSPEPVIQPEPQPEPLPVPEPATTTAEVDPLKDDEADPDTDGLTNGEEWIYGTDPSKSDTDGDGYSDSHEVENLYNPSGFKPTKLAETTVVQTYDQDAVGDVKGLSFFYPAGWKYGFDQGSGGVSVASPDGSQAFLISSAKNTEQQPVLDYYLRSRSATSPIEVAPFKTKSGLDAVLSKDGNEAFVAFDGVIVKLLHTRAESVTNTDAYRVTFKMFLNSLSKKP